MLTKLEKRKLKKKRKTALIVDNHMHPKIAGVKAVELVILPQKKLHQKHNPWIRDYIKLKIQQQKASPHEVDKVNRQR